MKNKLTKKLLTLCMMTTVFSVMSMNVNAEKIKKEEKVNYELRVDVYPKTIYIKNYLVTSTGLPSKTYWYSKPHDGVKYSGTLYLTSYQSVGDGRYLGLYSGYVNR